MDVSKMPRYVGPVNPSMLPSMSIALGLAGAAFTAWFFVYEVTSNKYTRSLAKEVVVATLAAAFLGFGSVMLLLWVGIYV